MNAGNVGGQMSINKQCFATLTISVYHGLAVTDDAPNYCCIGECRGYKSVRSQSIHINSLSHKLANLVLQFSRPLIMPPLGQTVAMSTLPSPQNPIMSCSITAQPGGTKSYAYPLDDGS